MLTIGLLPLAIIKFVKRQLSHAARNNPSEEHNFCVE